MDYLVIGLGITGISTVKTLSAMGHKVFAFDSNIKNNKQLPKELEAVDYIPIYDLDDIDENIVCIKSPGISVESDLIKEIKEKNIEVVSDLEMAYRLFKDRNLVAITGTNGKTTTTMMVNHILNENNISSMAIGNIGVGMLWEIYTNPQVEYFIIESSSFQLESTVDFRTNIASISNISPDHLDWHGSFDAYFNAKKKIFKNQTSDDTLVLNMDDEYLRPLIDEVSSKVVTVSLENENVDFYYKKSYIYSGKEVILDAGKLQIPGIHNVQNTIIAIAIARAIGVKNEDIAKACYSFKSVEHRIEFVRELNGVKFYNDSKGTNVDSTEKALSSFEEPIILIAGGYDKKVSFKELFEKYGSRIKKLILMGETAEQMKSQASNVQNISIVDNMKEAVELSRKEMENGDVVLLSPACASWGMYKSYIERGNEFKELVNNLGD